MEATKERKEQKHKEQEEQNTRGDSMGELGRGIIREAIITKSTDDDDRTRSVAKQPEDVLAYSRTVHQTDSSLE
ncbi:uncharacterized protein [Henckelia pumila]|uniref:uncharacterized protein n=1 Tax=Henckelia pumila TaxID=405737 RepID=UPI003C6DD8ED